MLGKFENPWAAAYNSASVDYDCAVFSNELSSQVSWPTGLPGVTVVHVERELDTCTIL